MSAIASKSVQTQLSEVGRRQRAVATDYIERNKAEWERWSSQYVERGREAWASGELRWGIWGIPEDELRLLDGLGVGADVLELGCGTAGVCASLARRGFSPTGVDIARPMLETAAEFEREFGVGFPLLCANAEQLHFEDASFDCAISDYGASLWCNPQRWIAEAARLLRPNGLLVFITNSAHLISCTPDNGGLAGDRLVRDYFSRYWVEFEGTVAVEFHVTHGDWVRLLRTNGFVIEDLIETMPFDGATPRTPFASAEWAKHWPSEEIWVARKAPQPSSADEASEPEAAVEGDDLRPDNLESSGQPERHGAVREHGDGSEERDAGGGVHEADPADVHLETSLVEVVRLLVPARTDAADESHRDPSPSVEPSEMELLSLSAATLDELAQLPGVGLIMAQRIVDHRSEHGPFSSVDDLCAVSGIGPTRIEQLRGLVAP